ncbi:CHAD domain-containing protein [Thiohalocapsa marina]|uniref:CHAD domain-containing protein n=1 Tax=Thiohalocapsa marina TaxID=424902 RepID=A0A5M8FDN6_9GAMM|nr:CHAD domain-containing protein [Thiohalocapsa marina]KAA6182988.1 CHAD domain-containing protein [Thiohalocapsa marina]
MSPEPMDFQLPQGGDIEAVLERIRATLSCEVEPEATWRRRYLDSFDWLLYGVGAALEEQVAGTGQEPGQGQSRRLLWIDLAVDSADEAQVLDAEPGFADDLPPGALRERLAPVLGVRRLLPMAEVNTRAIRVRVLNDDAKTVARIHLEDNRLSDPVSPARLSARLRLLPVRGYLDEFAATARLLQEIARPVAEPGVLVLEALAAAGRRPGDYSSKLDYRLDPAQRADAATRFILLGLLDTIETNIDGTRRNLDSEFLHDLRVAVRRTRSALGQIKGVFHDAAVAHFKAEFAWVQQVTGPVRDLDVYLLDFPNLRACLPEGLRADLDALRDWLSAHYDDEQQRLVQALASPRFTTLLHDWRVFLEGPLQQAAPDGAALPIKALADQRIWRMFKRVRGEGRAIDAQSPAEELHELRKSCKKLRYLMEFFQSLYPDKSMRRLIKQTKVLLDNLGRFQDLAVQAEHLRETAERMRADNAADVGTLLAMGGLVSHMLEGQQRARREFADTFAQFDTKDNCKLFRRLFLDSSGEQARHQNRHSAGAESDAADAVHGAGQ